MVDLFNDAFCFALHVADVQDRCVNRPVVIHCSLIVNAARAFQ